MVVPFTQLYTELMYKINMLIVAAVQKFMKICKIGEMILISSSQICILAHCVGACGGGVETHIDSDLVEVGGFRKVTEGSLVWRSWVDVSKERIWKPSLRIRLRR